MEKLADLVTRSIVAHSQPLKTRKMILFGYSFGAVLALEVAKRLESKGYEIALLLLDSSLDAERIRTDLTFNEMRHISYWNKIISIFEQHLNHAELRQIEHGVIHNQRLLHRYLLAQEINVQLLNSDMICIESSGNAGQGYMRCFGQKTSGYCRLLTTPGIITICSSHPIFRCCSVKSGMRLNCCHNQHTPMWR
ncbi:thioesterase domain-containing protein [Vibrio sp. PP-XX7]